MRTGVAVGCGFSVGLGVGVGSKGMGVRVGLRVGVVVGDAVGVIVGVGLGAGPFIVAKMNTAQAKANGAPNKIATRTPTDHLSSFTYALFRKNLKETYNICR